MDSGIYRAICFNKRFLFFYSEWHGVLIKKGEHAGVCAVGHNSHKATLGE